MLRHHLSRFLFCGAILLQPVHALSGGERARLSLACIAARSPQLPILDELSNNLDLRARQHVIEVLRDYPGSLLLISHDEAFLAAIGTVGRYDLGVRGEGKSVSRCFAC